MGEIDVNRVRVQLQANGVRKVAYMIVEEFLSQIQLLTRFWPRAAWPPSYPEVESSFLAGSCLKAKPCGSRASRQIDTIHLLSI